MWRDVRHRRAVRRPLAALGLVGWFGATPACAIILHSSTAGPSATGAVLETVLGADVFYAAGYDGRRATLASIEGGLPWRGHQTLEHAGLMPLYAGTQYSTQDHATGICHVLGGRGTLPHRRGLAPGAALFAGTVNKLREVSIAFDGPSVGRTYDAAMRGFTPQGGTGVVRADVINSSWGRIGTYTGYDPIVEQLEGLIYRSGTVVVAAAGNSGPMPNRFGPPGAALNVITVGAVTSASPPELHPAYTTVASFSSVSPTSVYFPGQTTILTRAAVDLVAPGTHYTVAGFIGPETPPNWYFGGRAGTSYASAAVAGGAALLVDVGYDRFVTPADRTAIDARTVRAVLLNSADKTEGWSNHTYDLDGVLVTNQALDHAAGAGRVNLARAFEQYTAGTTGAVFAADRVHVAPIGWDFDHLSLAQPQRTYVPATPLLGGTLLTATLTWFLEAGYDDTTDRGNMTALADLSLELLRHTDGGVQVVAHSDTLRNNIEHLHLTLPDTGTYSIAVRYGGLEFGTETGAAVPFALAWWGTPVPEPALACAGGVLAGWALRRRRQ